MVLDYRSESVVKREGQGGGDNARTGNFGRNLGFAVTLPKGTKTPHFAGRCFRLDEVDKST